jgi:hypothetical protein
MPDLSKISLDKYKNELKTGRLLPSRKPLLEGIDAKFNTLKKEGLNNLDDLKITLGSNTKFKQFITKTGLSENYLKLLRREIGSILPTPVKFSDVPNISKKIVKKLKDLSIINTETLFHYVRNSKTRQEFKKESGFTNEEVLWLTKLVDVSRIKWVGPKLARLIVDTKYDTVEKLVSANPSDVLDAFNEAKKLHKAYEGALGINDIDSWIRQVVSKTPKIINY